MKKETAVEWIQKIFKEREPDKFDWEQAKAMEKEQITNAYVYGSCYGVDLDKGLHPNNYFKETYKGGDQ